MLRMPWRCPVCRIQIQHSELDPTPRSGARYRCHVCRLELVLDPETNKLTVTPVADDEPDPRQRRTT